MKKFDQPGFLKWQVFLPIFAAVVFVSALPVEGASTCRGRLNFDEAYECEFRSELPSLSVDGTILFEEFDGNAFTATVALDDGEPTTGYCTCKTSGGRKAQFDRDKDFECVTGFDEGAAEAMEGRPTGNGKNIDHGQIWSIDALGQSFLRFAFHCGAEDDDDSDGDEESDEDSDEDGDEDSDDDGGDDSDGESSELSVAIQPKNWKTQWLDRGNGTVSVKISGEGFEDIDLSSIQLIGTDPAAEALESARATRQGNHVRALFGQSDAIKTLDNPQKGETHSIWIEFDLGGVPTMLMYNVRITGK